MDRQADYPCELPLLAQAGMQQADENADARWKRETDAAVRQVALTHTEFTADEVVAELDRNQFHWTTHNQAALGPRLKEVAREMEYMEGTEQVRRSKRPKSHGNLLRVWRSRIYATNR